MAEFNTMTARNISEARLLSLKHCSHLDLCNYFGNCMTFGSEAEAFCSCISANVDHTCSASLPTASALSTEPRDFLYPAIAFAILAVVILALMYFALNRRRSSRLDICDPPTDQRISVALKSVDDA